MGERDLVGYGGCPPHPRWPNDARVAVPFVLNIEEGAESGRLNGDVWSELICFGRRARGAQR